MKLFAMHSLAFRGNAGLVKGDQARIATIYGIMFEYIVPAKGLIMLSLKD